MQFLKSSTQEEKEITALNKPKIRKQSQWQSQLQ